MHFSLQPEMEFKEFEPRFKSAKTRYKLSAGLNLETFETILNRRSNSLNSATGLCDECGLNLHKALADT